MNTQSMNILVIEDNAKHLADAQKFFTEHHPAVAVTYVKLLIEAISELEPHSYSAQDKQLPHGVISDIFFPCGYPPHDTEEPCGVAVKTLCHNRGIPCVLNTTGHHHGVRFQWICKLGENMGWPDMIDGPPCRDEENESKNWELAFRRLRAIMDGKSGFRPEANE